MLVVEWVLSIFLLYTGICTVYLLIFSLAGRFAKTQQITSVTHFTKKIAVLIPAYKEDNVIVDTARQALQQSYPTHLYDVVIIADSLQPVTLQQLRTLPVTLIEVQFKKSTKAKALNAAMQKLPDYSYVIVLDADNIMAADFLEKMSLRLERGFLAVQGHRTAKNTNTSVAILDAISEEINNHIFRKGHQALALSSALIGSAMGFEYRFFKEKMASVQAVGGFDKELEIQILKEGIRIQYAEDAIVYDEKVQNTTDFEKQRTRWIAAQFNFLQLYFSEAIEQLFLKRNIDFFNKVFQMMMLPRIMLLGLLCINNIFTLLINNLLLVCINLGISTLLLVTLYLSIPRKLLVKFRLTELINLPVIFIKYAGSLINIKAAKKNFIHTPHGKFQQ